MPRASELTAEQVASIKQLIDSGESCRSISQRLRLSRHIVLEILHGRYKPREEHLHGRQSVRFLHGMRCECGAMVVEMYRLEDDALVCLACAIRSGRADKKTVPMHTNPMISDTLFSYEDLSGRGFAETNEDSLEINSDD